MKKKYIMPESAVYACNMKDSLMTGSNTGSIPVGGTGTKPRYAPEHEDNSSIFSHKGIFDEIDQDDLDDIGGVSTDKAVSSDLW